MSEDNNGSNNDHCSLYPLENEMINGQLQRKPRSSGGQYNRYNMKFGQQGSSFMQPEKGSITNSVEVLVRKDGLIYSLDSIINSLFQLKKGYEKLDDKIEQVKTCIKENIDNDII